MTSPRSASRIPSQMYMSALRWLPEKVAENAQPIGQEELAADIAEARHFPQGFRAWLRHWHFTNRETGGDHTFADLWPGQVGFADLMVETAGHTLKGQQEWLFALKAGKLGFTELECAWDGYVAWARRNARIHLFSKEEDAAKAMLKYLLYGLRSLETAWGVHFIEKEGGRIVPWQRAGSQTLLLAVLAPGGERDLADTRTIQAFATSKNPAIDKTAQHAHVDEWAHMEHPKDVWSSIGTTVSPEGTCHIVTRGNGENKDVEEQWAVALAKTGKLRAYFADWTKRPDRDQAWLAAEAATLRTVAAVSHFAPENPEDAFRGDEDNDFLPAEWWDRCHDPSIAIWIPRHDGVQVRELAGAQERGQWMGNLQPGDNTPLVIGLDAGISHDNFGIVGVGRHPDRHDDPAIRLCKVYRPEDFEDEQIDQGTVQTWLRMVCLGGCPNGHPRDPEWAHGRKTRRVVGQAYEPGDCPACHAIDRGEAQPLPPFNVVQIVYDPFQLEGMMQEMRRDNVAWCEEMPQGSDRLEADRNFYDVVVNRRLAHPGDPRLREHVLNAKSKMQKDEDSKFRMIKKAPHRRIDLAVSAAMATMRCMYLNL